MAEFLPDGSFDNPLAPIDWTKLGLTLPAPDVNPPQDWSVWWDSLLWGDRPHVLFNDPRTILPGMAKDVQDAGSNIGDYVGGVGASIQQAASDAVNKSTSEALPYLALGGLTLAALLLLQRPAR